MKNFPLLKDFLLKGQIPTSPEARFLHEQLFVVTLVKVAASHTNPCQTPPLSSLSPPYLPPSSPSMCSSMTFAAKTPPRPPLPLISLPRDNGVAGLQHLAVVDVGLVVVVVVVARPASILASLACPELHHIPNDRKVNDRQRLLLDEKFTLHVRWGGSRRRRGPNEETARRKAESASEKLTVTGDSNGPRATGEPRPRAGPRRPPPPLRPSALGLRSTRYI